MTGTKGPLDGARLRKYHLSGLRAPDPRHARPNGVHDVQVHLHQLSSLHQIVNLDTCMLAVEKHPCKKTGGCTRGEEASDRGAENERSDAQADSETDTE